mmetsp:Transcript_176576/g.566148  ORF Transcript_176576/g.566148 Transcript_176576/m.566148 type:complete len:256 (-) Transcript_176576:486-1253(-)
MAPSKSWRWPALSRATFKEQDVVSRAPPNRHDATSCEVWGCDGGGRAAALSPAEGTKSSGPASSRAVAFESCDQFTVHGPAEPWMGSTTNPRASTRKLQDSYGGVASPEGLSGGASCRNTPRNSEASAARDTSGGANRPWLAEEAASGDSFAEKPTPTDCFAAAAAASKSASVKKMARGDNKEQTGSSRASCSPPPRGFEASCWQPASPCAAVRASEMARATAAQSVSVASASVTVVPACAPAPLLSPRLRICNN